MSKKEEKRERDKGDNISFGCPQWSSLLELDFVGFTVTQ